MSYVIAIVVMALIAIVAVLAITITRPEVDNTQLIATILGFVGTMTAAVLSLIKSQETHVLVNSQLSQWKADYAARNRAEGAKEAVDTEQARVAHIKETAVIASALRVKEKSLAPPIPVKVEDAEPVRVEIEKPKQGE